MPQTVLVVEDTDLLRRMYVDRLNLDGFRVLSAGDGREALAVMSRELPDLVLLDLVMPVMSGVELLERMRSDPRLRGVRVLILSNLGREDEIAECIELGACDYLIKNDVRPAEISQTVAKILAVPVGTAGSAVYRLQVRDRELDADRFVADASLTRRFWCPTCEVELAFELAPMPGTPGHYDAHVVCPMCGREY